MQGEEDRIQDTGFRVLSTDYRVQGEEYRIQYAGYRVLSTVCRVTSGLSCISFYLPDRN